MPEDGIRGIMARMNESCEGYSGLIRFIHPSLSSIDQLLFSHSIKRLWHVMIILLFELWLNLCQINNPSQALSPTPQHKSQCT